MPIEGKTSCLKSLYNLEKENGDYKKANTYLEEHAAIIDSLYCMEQSTEIQQLIYEYNTKMRVREEQLKGKRIIYCTFAGFVAICFIIILAYQNYINWKKRIQLQYKQSLEQTQNKLSSLETTIENNQLMITLLKQEHENKEQQIEELSIAANSIGDKKIETSHSSLKRRETTVTPLVVCPKQHLPKSDYSIPTNHFE